MTNVSSAAIPRADLFEGVRTRRILALVIDLFIVSILAAVLWIALLILTLGLSLFFLPPLFPLVAFFYNGLTV
ncbi:MAG: RDD family protein, partial [Hyphomicrobiales bacterium]|nr:RDD family protein [Hyphomicrobiales bacterium]